MSEDTPKPPPVFKLSDAVVENIGADHGATGFRRWFCTCCDHTITFHVTPKGVLVVDNFQKSNTQLEAFLIEKEESLGMYLIDEFLRMNDPATLDELRKWISNSDAMVKIAQEAWIIFASSKVRA